MARSSTDPRRKLEARPGSGGGARVTFGLSSVGPPPPLIVTPPKDDSRRDAELPGWLSKLVSGHITRTASRPCECHGLIYVFRDRLRRSALTLLRVRRLDLRTRRIRLVPQEGTPAQAAGTTAC